MSAPLSCPTDSSTPPRSVYAAFEVFPRPKGASSHIAAMVTALAEQRGPVWLLCCGFADMPAWQREGGIVIHRHKIHHPNLLRRAVQFGDFVYGRLAGLASPPELCVFRDPWSGWPALSSALPDTPACVRGQRPAQLGTARITTGLWSPDNTALQDQNRGFGRAFAWTTAGADHHGVGSDPRGSDRPVRMWTRAPDVHRAQLGRRDLFPGRRRGLSGSGVCLNTGPVVRVLRQPALPGRGSICWWTPGPAAAGPMARRSAAPNCP